MSSTPTTLGGLLKRARMARGWSRVELERHIDISAKMIAKYEKAGEAGGQYPSMPRLALLAAELDLDARVLVASCAENQATAKKLLVTDAVQYKGTDKSFGLAVLFKSLLSKDENITDNDFTLDDEDASEYLQEVEKITSHLGLSLYGNPEIEQIIRAKSKKSSKDDLLSPSSSNPIKPRIKENDDGQSSD